MTLHFYCIKISLGIVSTLLIIYIKKSLTFSSKLTMIDSHTSLFYD